MTGTDSGPDLRWIETLARLIEPAARIARPLSLGIERIPPGPVVFAGNHTIMGVLDIPFLYLELYRRAGVYPRALGDHAHFRVPGWRTLLGKLGAVDGTPENCARLLRAGESILVFPGGGREVAKRRNERYKLIWKQRAGFVRQAAAVGAPIVPFAAVGADDAYDVILDANDVLRSPLGLIVRRLGLREEVLFPLVRGVGPFPRLERLYFWFGAPVQTAHLAGRTQDADAIFAVRESVRLAVEAGLRELLALRSADPERSLRARIRALARRRR